MTLRFQEIFLTESHFLFDGPMETRIKYHTDITLDKNLSLFQLLYQQKGMNALAKFYRQDFQIAESFNIPIIAHTPTLCASEAIIQQYGFKVPEGTQKINADAVKFVRSLSDQFPEFNEGIFVGGAVGPRIPIYSQQKCDATENMTIDEAKDYHSPQIFALAQAKADIISINMMTNKNETIGCAQAAAKADLTYGVGIIATLAGTLLDGTPIEDVIREIDNTISPRPFFYALNCIQPNQLASIFSRQQTQYDRILGVKANAFDKTPAQFAKMKHAPATNPQDFAQTLVSQGTQYHFKIYGGCCGTDHRHQQALCQSFKMLA